MNTPGSLNSPVVNTRGVLIPSGEYIGESWLPVVDFLVYFEQHQNRFTKKFGDERPGSQDSPMYYLQGSLNYLPVGFVVNQFRSLRSGEYMNTPRNQLWIHLIPWIFKNIEILSEHV
jgi:hypothetical protein